MAYGNFHANGRITMTKITIRFKDTADMFDWVKAVGKRYNETTDANEVDFIREKLINKLEFEQGDDILLPYSKDSNTVATLLAKLKP
jgi:hypothetical protein